jgi:phage tail-like protein
MSPMPPPVRYAPARSGASWPEVALAGLAIDPGGDIHLRRMPALSPPWLAAPGEPGASGLALDRACGLYVADTEANRIRRIGLDCHTEVVLPGAHAATVPGVLGAPAGLAVGDHEWLFVANAGDGRVLVFSTPDLTLRDAWSGFVSPVALACHDGRVVIVDAGTERVVRRHVAGHGDPAFDALLASGAGLADPRAVAIDEGGTIYVGDAASGSVLRFAWSGAASGAALATGTQPRALAVRDGVLYVGDAVSGQVLLYAATGGESLGAVSGFGGPVTALAVGESSLFVKAGLDAGYLAATLGGAFATTGTLVSGPLDAGEEVGWRRAAVEVEVEVEQPSDTAVTLEYHLDDTPTPAVVPWQAAPALDLLLNGRRYLWLRVTLTTRRPAASPTLRQVQASTAGDSYLDLLPYVYTHDPDRPGISEALLESADPSQFAPGDLGYLRAMYARTPPEGDFLVRLLALAQSELDDLDHAVAGLPGLFDPATAPASMLRWLATWLAFDLPPRFADGDRPDEVRALLLGLAGLYRRRGTPRGVADFVEVYSGVRPQLFEDFQARPLWVLGETPLGFGTGVPDRDLDGVLVGDGVVGATGPEDPSSFGTAAFASTAHRFSVLVPTAGLDAAGRDLVTGVVEAEKPAHTGFHVCFVEPRMRVGVQARVGLDAVLGAEPEPMALGESAVVGVDTRLTGLPADAPGGVGGHGQLGIDTRIG